MAALRGVAGLLAAVLVTLLALLLLTLLTLPHRERRVDGLREAPRFVFDRAAPVLEAAEHDLDAAASACCAMTSAAVRP